MTASFALTRIGVDRFDGFRRHEVPVPGGANIQPTDLVPDGTGDVAVVVDGRLLVGSAAGLRCSMSPSARSGDLLKRAQLVETERHGQFVTYRVADPAVSNVLNAVRVLGERRLFGDRARHAGVSRRP